jgi:hypothetical protein
MWNFCVGYAYGSGKVISVLRRASGWSCLMRRTMKKLTGLTTVAVLGGAIACLAGCHVNERKDASGKSENVKIDTPFGGMSVNTNDAVVEGGTGMTPYPGATIVKKDNDNSAADVNMSFGSFHLGVKAISYQTPDAPEKVLAFYRKDLARFGTVILCQGDHAVGTPDRTADGLSCDKTKHTKIAINDSGGEQQLKAGSRQHQHIVGIDPNGSGTKIGLVMLDLPKGVDSSDKDESQ